MAEWLRRLTRKQLWSSRAGSNPAGCDLYKPKELIFRWINRVFFSQICFEY